MADIRSLGGRMLEAVECILIVYDSLADQLDSQASLPANIDTEAELAFAAAASSIRRVGDDLRKTTLSAITIAMQQAPRAER